MTPVRRAAIVAGLLLAAFAVPSAAQAYTPVPSAFQTVTATTSIPAHTVGNVSVTCPSGTTSISRGFSAPEGVEPTSASGYFMNTTASAQEVTGYARCVDLAAAGFTQQGSTYNSYTLGPDGGVIGGWSSACPSGQVALQGDAYLNGDYGAWYNDRLLALAPAFNHRSFTARAYGYATGSDRNFIIRGQCYSGGALAGVRRYTVMNKNETTSDQVISQQVACPAGTQLLTGGTFTTRWPTAGGSEDSQTQTIDEGVPFVSRPGTSSGGEGWSSSTTVRGQSIGYTNAVYTNVECVPSANPTLAVAVTADSSGASSASITLGDPANDSSSSDPQFTYTGTCTLDGAPVACDGINGWSGTVADGSHTLNVSVTSSDGRTVSKDVTWVMEHTPPTASITPLGLFTLAGSVPVNFTATDAGSGVKSIDVRYRQANYNGTFGSYQLPSAWQGLAATTTQLSSSVPAGYTRCFSVRAHDELGNTSTWSTERCTAKPLDDRALTRSTGWTALTSSSYYMGTELKTTTLNAGLTKSGALTDRIALVVTRCATCGSLRVRVGTKTIGTVSTYSSTVKNKQLIVLPQITLGTGTVKLTNVSSGKPVRIDGLGLTQR